MVIKSSAGDYGDELYAHLVWLRPDLVFTDLSSGINGYALGCMTRT